MIQAAFHVSTFGDKAVGITQALQAAARSPAGIAYLSFLSRRLFSAR